MANKAARIGGYSVEQPWFKKRRVKNRKRDKAAKLARRKNRK